MKFQLSSVQKQKIGTCPHGLPQGACPVCLGMGGGGGGSLKKANNSGEMSWDECYAVWQQMLKAKEIAQQKKLDAIQAQMQTPVNFTAKLDKAAQKIAHIIEKLSDLIQKAQASTNIFSKLAAFGAKISIPILNVIKNVSIIAQKTINFIQQKLADITDKLNAMFGEIKASTEKKVSDKLKDFKKKFKSIFGISEPEDIDDEEKKIEETKRLFEFKTVLTSIKEKFTRKEIKE